MDARMANGQLAVQEPDEMDMSAEAQGSTARRARAQAVTLDALRLAASAGADRVVRDGGRFHPRFYLLAGVVLTAVAAVMWLAIRAA